MTRGTIFLAAIFSVTIIARPGVAEDKVFMTAYKPRAPDADPSSNSKATKEVPIVSLKDLLEYDAKHHTALISKTALERIDDHALEGWGFRIYANGKLAYSGGLFLIIFSSTFEGVVAVPGNYEGGHNLALQLGFPSKEHYRFKSDPRSGAGVISWLDVNGKLQAGDSARNAHRNAEKGIPTKVPSTK